VVVYIVWELFSLFLQVIILVFLLRFFKVKLYFYMPVFSGSTVKL